LRWRSSFGHVGLLHDEGTVAAHPRSSLRPGRSIAPACWALRLRVAYMVFGVAAGRAAAARPLKVERHRLVLRLEGETAALAGDRVSSRLKQLARPGRPRAGGDDLT